jgi:hypothetical protein
MSRGLGQLVPYFECQYPQVAPLSNAQFQAIASTVAVNSGGMGDYVSPFAFPIPQYLTPGNNRGLGCGDCGGTCGCSSGLGLFDTMDPTEWGAGEYGVLAIGALVLYMMTRTVNQVERGYRKTRGKVKGKVRKVKAGVKKRTGAARTLFTGS